MRAASHLFGQSVLISVARHISSRTFSRKEVDVSTMGGLVGSGSKWRPNH
jgi:hypothetical protein